MNYQDNQFESNNQNLNYDFDRYVSTENSLDDCSGDINFGNMDLARLMEIQQAKMVNIRNLDNVFKTSYYEFAEIQEIHNAVNNASTKVQRARDRIIDQYSQQNETLADESTFSNLDLLHLFKIRLKNQQNKN